ncbi:MAG: hypothetical protein GY913_05440 [Proteobacteria bacterium]|nr:hypothetical protein [Pseudomonadota bacterium]
MDAVHSLDLEDNGPLELDASELVTVTGDLTLDGVDLWPILSSLESVDEVTISSSEITEITLPSLTQVTELSMGSSEFVESVDLGALTTADVVYVSVGGSHLDLGSLSSVDTVDIGMTDLTDLDLGSLKRTKDLDLTGCASLEDLSGLAIERVDDLALQGLKALTSLTGLEALTETSDRFYLRGLDSLQDFEGMGDTAIGGDLEAYQNEGFIDLDGLEGVSVAGEACFVSNTNLERVDGLSGVVDIGELNLSSNDALAEIALSSLTTVTNDVMIYNNAVLTDIGGLSGLTSVGRNLKIKDNPELSTTDAEALRDSIGTANIGGTITISGNGS